MSNLDRIVRNSGVLDRLRPLDAIKQQRADAQVIDEAGRINPAAAAPFRTPLALHWSPGSTARQRAAQAGTAVLLAAHAATPPTTGNCTITLTMVTAVMGVTTIGTCQITSGQTIGETQLAYPVPAGSWLGAVVSQASGASGVSISLTIKAGG